jgi:hypothetical protein
VVQRISPSLALMKRPAISALAADDIMCLMMPDMVRIAPLLGMGLFDVVVAPRYRWPLAQLRPLVTDK